MPSSRSDRIEKARILLRPAVSGVGGVWADLGCGDGIFTIALYTLAEPRALYAVDKSRRALKALQQECARHFPKAAIHTLKADFAVPLSLPPLDGVVMANSLHFLRDKASVVNLVKAYLKPAGCLIVVEYNTDWGNQWVPFPLDENAFLKLAQEAGLREAQVMAKIPSTFLGEMYSGIGFTPTIQDP